MQPILGWLRQPFLMGQSTEAWRIATGAGLFIYFFLVVFEPFRIHEITDIAYKHRLLAGYGLVTALGMLVAFLLLPKFLPTFYQEEHWTVGRQIFSVMLAVWLIGCGNFFYSVLALGTPIRWSAFLFFQGVTFLLGIFPVAIITLLQYNRHLKRNLLEAKVLSGALPQVPHPAPILVLKDDQGKTLMSLTADKFLYAMADDNYVDVYCLQDQKAVRQVLRYTLTKLEADCSPAVDIIRCHRKYMVNLSKVTNVEGNAQGLKLRVAVSENFIPVSRAMVEPIKRRLSDH